MWICIILVILYPLPRIEKIAHILYVVFTKIACRGNNECQVSISNPLIYVTCYITNNYEILFSLQHTFYYNPVLYNSILLLLLKVKSTLWGLLLFCQKEKGRQRKQKSYLHDSFLNQYAEKLFSYKAHSTVK